MSWHVLKLDLNSARWMPKLVSIDAQSYPALMSHSLRATLGPVQDNWPLFRYVIGISGILPYNRNVTLHSLLRTAPWCCCLTSLTSSLSWLIGKKSSPALGHKVTGALLPIVLFVPLKSAILSCKFSQQILRTLLLTSNFSKTRQ